MNRNEIYEFLKNKFEKEFINKVLYYLFNSNHINRYFLNDFTEIIGRSKFNVNNIIIPIFPVQPPEDIAKILKDKFGNIDFTNQGLLILLEK